jgi:hypothetical protein
MWRWTAKGWSAQTKSGQFPPMAGTNALKPQSQPMQVGLRLSTAFTSLTVLMLACGVAACDSSTSPRNVFKRSWNRLVFWYDSTGERGETLESFTDPQVVKLKVARNEFGTKVRVVRDPTPDAKFLLYVPASRPADVDNWLLDLLLQGYEFRADKASLALQEVGLPHEFLYLAEDTLHFSGVKSEHWPSRIYLGKTIRHATFD